MTQISIYKKKSKKIDLEKFIDSRGLICANSGGGKSYAVRKLLEESNDKVICIILDVEGEFKTLREKYDFLLIGEGGDVDLNERSAKLLPSKILELNIPTIIDISELKRKQRILYAKHFLEALMECPRKLWKPCLVVLDEAHLLCGQQEKQDSYAAVIDLMTRGRKRGFCGILCTQRISKLHKDAVAEANNIMIGRTGLDIDMKRASEILGFTSKQDMLSLRDLEPGEFYVFGTSISRYVEKEMVAEVNTTHPKAGMDIGNLNITATNKVKGIISKLADLPKQEQDKIQQQRDYISEIDSLKRQLRTAQSGKVDTTELNILKQEITSLKKQNSQEIGEYQKALKILESKLRKIGVIIGSEVNITIEKPVSSPINYQKIKGTPIQRVTPISTSTQGNGSITAGAMRMLKAAAMFYPNPISKARMGAIAGMSYRSGTFGTYIATLKREGAVDPSGDGFVATEHGMSLAGDVEPLPTDSESIVELWAGIVKGGAARMLRVLASHYPESIPKDQLGEEAEISSTSGTFGTYLATLKRNGLIVRQGSMVKASDELFS